jgi:hypothetical protein
MAQGTRSGADPTTRRTASKLRRRWCSGSWPMSPGHANEGPPAPSVLRSLFSPCASRCRASWSWLPASTLTTASSGRFGRRQPRWRCSAWPQPRWLPVPRSTTRFCALRAWSPWSTASWPVPCSSASCSMPRSSYVKFYGGKPGVLGRSRMVVGNLRARRRGCRRRLGQSQALGAYRYQLAGRFIARGPLRRPRTGRRYDRSAAVRPGG